MHVRFMGRPGLLEQWAWEPQGRRAGEAAWLCSSRCLWSACHLPDPGHHGARDPRPSGSATSRKREGVRTCGSFHVMAMSL